MLYLNRPSALTKFDNVLFQVTILILYKLTMYMFRAVSDILNYFFKA